MTATASSRRAGVSGTRQRGFPPVLVFVVAWIGAFLLCAAWSISSPLSSAPDESGHVMKAAASARGVWTGTTTDSQGITSFRLPGDVANVGGALTCFVGNPNQTADCQPSLDAQTHRDVTVESGVGDYNPAYYVAVGWPSLVMSGTASYIGTRLMSALVNSFFIALLFLVAAWMPRARAFTAFVAIALTPMVLYLGGVVNPNGVEISACAALTALAWLVVHDRTNERLALRMSLLALSGVVAGSMRSTSPVFVVGILVAVLLTVPVGRVVELVRKRPVWIAGVASVLLLVPALVWTVLVAAPAGFIPGPAPYPTIGQALVHSITSTGDYGVQMVGVFGWLDTTLSQGVIVGWTAAFGFVVLGALLVGWRRALIGPVVLMAAVLLAPAVLQAPNAPTYGYIWQGRYGLPVLVAMVLVCGFVVDEHVLRPEVKSRLVAVVQPLWIVAQGSAFVWAYRRYSVGISGSRAEMVHGGGWQAPGGFVLLFAVFVVGALVLGVLSVVLSRRRLPGVALPDDTTVPPPPVSSDDQSVAEQSR